MVPTWTGETGKWENFFQSGNFEQTGKVREFYQKYWKNEGVLSKILESEEILASFYFFSDFFIEVCLLNRFCIS